MHQVGDSSFRGSGLDHKFLSYPENIVPQIVLAFNFLDCCVEGLGDYIKIISFFHAIDHFFPLLGESAGGERGIAASRDRNPQSLSGPDKIAPVEIIRPGNS